MSIVTGKARFSYVSVFEPRETPNGEEKYSMTLLIPKSDTVTYQKIIDEINKTLEDNVAEKFKGVMPANPRLPLHDGDGLTASGEHYGAECKGHWVINASAKLDYKPDVVDANGNPILNKNELYSGCYGRAMLLFYAYNQNGNKGIGCGLGPIQKLEDGQPLDGRKTAAEVFGKPTANSSFQQPVNTATYQQPKNYSVDPITGQPINNIYGVN